MAAVVLVMCWIVSKYIQNIQKREADLVQMFEIETDA